MISFFAKEPFSVLDSRDGKPYLKRISSIVRGKQIADYIGGKFNPKEGEGLGIHLKPLKMDRVKDGDYVDVLDDTAVHIKLGTLLGRVAKRPKVNVIAMTSAHKEWLERLLPNKIVHIPHQHMNFERIRSERHKQLTCGYIGTYVGRHEELCNALETQLARGGIKFVSLFTYPSREDIIKFYQSIDIQVIPMFGYLTNVPQYHEKKIVDAMSFGIPTITEEKLGYRDVNGYYIKVNSMSELVSEAVKLKDGWDAERLITKAEDYHISNIAEKYKALCNSQS